jgi:hypothetical protein
VTETGLLVKNNFNSNIFVSIPGFLELAVEWCIPLS